MGVDAIPCWRPVIAHAARNPGRISALSATPNLDRWPLPDAAAPRARSSAPASDTRPIAVVLNGAAGALLDRASAVGSITELFDRAGLTPDFVPLDVGALPERVAQARRMDPCAVAVAGGDGTITCAAQVLAGTGTPLGILPFGTMNLLARDLGIPAGAPEDAVQIMARGAVRDIDVAEVNGRVFLCACMIGLPARLGRVREAERPRARGVRLWTRMGLASVRLIRRYFPRRFVLEADGRSRVIRATAITITANAIDEPGGRAFGRAHLDRGELAVYIVERLKFVDLARLALALLRGTWHREPIVHEFRTAEVTLHAGRRLIRVMNDGENVLMAPPLRFRIRPRALRVFVPAPPT